ncbi:MAG: flippase-like domain-containing protein [Opitutaceae bacterium]|nr:flippase-like domain-containing protein [Cytophagales bacterium]
MVNIHSVNAIYFWLSFGLCSLNWFYEAAKWQTAANLIESISIKKALKSVLTGQALNFIFPASVGHILGRIVNIGKDKKSKVQAASLVFVCQTVQMLVTFGFSCMGFLYLYKEINLSKAWVYVLSISLISIIAMVAILYLQKRNTYVRIFSKILSQLPSITVFKLVLLSSLRYIIFTFQYILILRFLGCELEFIRLASGLSLVFMAKSMMPSFHVLSDLGIREFAALLVLPIMGIPNTIVICASLYVWFINILMPSIAGAFILLQIKWKSRYC